MNFQPDKPMHIRYIDYIVNAAQGDFGQSVIVEPGISNVQLILEAAPWTIFLSSVGLVYGLVAGIVLGSMMAYYEGSRFDVGTTVSIIFTGAIPYYIVALLMLSYFSYDLGWFPIGGRYNTDTVPGFNYPFLAGVFNHAVLPLASTIILGFAGRALGLRANSIRVLGSDYIRAAQLRGLSSYTIATRYMARNAILPMYTGILIGLSGLIGGAVILEQIFNYSGMGLLMFKAAMQRDFPLLTTNIILTTVLFVVGTLLADFTYSLIDPRAEQSSRG
jgi:peptide/nickel transport system permease protein